MHIYLNLAMSILVIIHSKAILIKQSKQHLVCLITSALLYPNINQFYLKQNQTHTLSLGYFGFCVNTHFFFVNYGCIINC